MPREKRVQSNRPSKNALSTVESDMLPSPERVAELDIEEGSALRSQSEQYRSQSKQQSSHLNKTSNGTITERVKVTEKVKEDLQYTLQELEEEVELLDENMERLTAIVDFEERAGEHVRTTMRQRKSRTPREAAKDEVEHSIKAFYEELRGSLFSSFATDCRKYRQSLMKIRPDLDRNIEYKSEAIRLDMECLSIGIDSSPLKMTSPSKGSPSSRGKKTTPSLWQSSADDLMHQSKQKVSHSSNLRNKIDAYRQRRIETALETLRVRVLQALENKLQQLVDERDGCGGLAERLDEVRADMEHNQESVEELKAAISAHASSLEIAKMRLRTRENRPDGYRIPSNRDPCDLLLIGKEFRTKQLWLWKKRKST